MIHGTVVARRHIQSVLAVGLGLAFALLLYGLLTRASSSLGSDPLADGRLPVVAAEDVTALEFVPSSVTTIGIARSDEPSPNPVVQPAAPVTEPTTTTTTAPATTPPPTTVPPTTVPPPTTTTVLPTTTQLVTSITFWDTVTLPTFPLPTITLPFETSTTRPDTTVTIGPPPTDPSERTPPIDD